MASSGNSSNDAFDVRKIRRLVELMNEHSLAEIDLRQGDQRIRLSRNSQREIVTQRSEIPVPAVAAVESSSAAAAPAPAKEAAPDEGTFILSPMVGTFYRSPNPEAAPFVDVGDQVGPDSPVCIIEAMKVFNEIQAENSGKIAEVLVEDGAAIEFGQKLFRLS